MQTKISQKIKKPKVSQRFPAVLGLAVAGLFMHQTEAATVDLGTAGNFAILAGAAITDAGGASSIIGGDVGVYPAAGEFNEIQAGQVTDGTVYYAETDGALLLQAKNDLTTAYNDAGSRPFTLIDGADNQLGGTTLTPGVYRFSAATTANLIGTLTLDSAGEIDPVWIFQTESTLVTASNSSVVFLDGGTSCDVFWWVGSSATIGTGTEFIGNILADQSIGLQTNATLDGSALARIASVTLDHNVITHLNCDEGDNGNGNGDNGNGDNGNGDNGNGDNGNGNGTPVPETGGSLFLLGFALSTLVVGVRRGRRNKQA